MKNADTTEDRLLRSLLKPFMEAAGTRDIAKVRTSLRFAQAAGDLGCEDLAIKAAEFSAMFVMIRNSAMTNITSPPAMQGKLLVVEDVSSVPLMTREHNLMVNRNAHFVSLPNIKAAVQQYEQSVRNYTVVDMEAHAKAVHEALLAEAIRLKMPLIMPANFMGDAEKALVETIGQQGYEVVRVQTMPRPAPSTAAVASLG